MNHTTLAIKIDVDTERGTRLGIAPLINLFQKQAIPATFLFSLGPDRTGLAIKRIFRKGFLSKVGRTSIISTYGIRTLMNGLLLPAPHIGHKHAKLLQQFKEAGDFEMGIHCYDHIRWQDHLCHMSEAEVFNEFQKASHVFEEIFSEKALSAGSAGWQANAISLQAYDNANLLYGSDTRGRTPFIPVVDNKAFKTLQIPSTLPTLDELIGRPEYPQEKLIPHYLSLIKKNQLNVLTIHAELEGMKHFDWFKQLITKIKETYPDLQFERLDRIAKTLRADLKNLPFCKLEQGEIDGRSGALALQGKEI